MVVDFYFYLPPRPPFFEICVVTQAFINVTVPQRFASLKCLVLHVSCSLLHVKAGVLTAPVSSPLTVRSLVLVYVTCLFPWRPSDLLLTVRQ